MSTLSRDPVDRSAPSRPAKLPAIVWATGWVSFFTDLSTEMIYGILPAFFLQKLKLSVAWMGLIEGAAETIVSMSKLFAGHWSDRTGRRKWWMVAGYGLSTLAKPLLVFAQGGVTVLLLRGADRLGKGVRGAPRDALLSREITADQRGRAFGIQRAMDHGGALAGGVVGATLIYFHLATLEQLFWWTLLPGGMAVLIILLFVKERDEAVSAGAPKPVLSIGESWRQQSSTVRRYLVVLGIFALGNSTDMLLLALSRERFLAANLPRERADAAVLLLWGWLHVVKSMSSPWGGRLSDRIGRLPTVCAGWVIYAGVYAGFALWAAPAAPWVLFAVYGLYYGLVEGPERALVADLSPDPDRRGMAYGLFHFVTGMAALPASLLCGGLWWWLQGVTWLGMDLGPLTAFGTGAALALLSALLLPWALRVREKVSG